MDFLFTGSVQPRSEYSWTLRIKQLELTVFCSAAQRLFLDFANKSDSFGLVAMISDSDLVFCLLCEFEPGQ
jgi:hypothetical protein